MDNRKKHCRKDLLSHLNNMFTKTTPRRRLILSTEKRKPNSTKHIRLEECTPNTLNNGVITKYLSLRKLSRPWTNYMTKNTGDCLLSTREIASTKDTENQNKTPDNTLGDTSMSSLKRSSFGSAIKKMRTNDNFKSKLELRGKNPYCLLLPL